MAAAKVASASLTKAEFPAAADEDRGIRSYYQSKIDELDLIARDRAQNLQRLKAQRNELNAKVLDVAELSCSNPPRNSCACRSLAAVLVIETSWLLLNAIEVSDSEAAADTDVGIMLSNPGVFAARRAAPSTRVWLICWRSCQGYGQRQSVSEGQ
jgi:hypothetical protein